MWYTRVCSSRVAVYSDHHVYLSNKKLDILGEINYPSIKSTQIFKFINEVRRNQENNAIYASGNTNPQTNTIDQVNRLIDWLQLY